MLGRRQKCFMVHGPQLSQRPLLVDPRTPKLGKLFAGDSVTCQHLRSSLYAGNFAKNSDAAPFAVVVYSSDTADINWAILTPL